MMRAGRYVMAALERRKPRWTLMVLFAVAALVVLFLLAARAGRTPWRVRVEPRNWRVYISESVHTDSAGKVLRSSKAYYLGPLVIFSEPAAAAPLSITNVISPNTPRGQSVIPRVTLVDVVMPNPSPRTPSPTNSPFDPTQNFFAPAPSR